MRLLRRRERGVVIDDWHAWSVENGWIDPTEHADDRWPREAVAIFADVLGPLYRLKELCFDPDVLLEEGEARAVDLPPAAIARSVARRRNTRGPLTIARPGVASIALAGGIGYQAVTRLGHALETKRIRDVRIETVPVLCWADMGCVPREHCVVVNEDTDDEFWLTEMQHLVLCVWGPS